MTLKGGDFSGKNYMTRILLLEGAVTHGAYDQFATIRPVARDNRRQPQTIARLVLVINLKVI